MSEVRKAALEEAARLLEEGEILIPLDEWEACRTRKEHGAMVLRHAARKVRALAEKESGE